MSQVSTTISTQDIASEKPRSGLISLYLELGKARLSFLVVVTAVVGYLVAARGVVQGVTLLWLAVGTALAAGCANALNQVMEVDRDKKMRRTEGRPIPSGRIGHIHATGVAMLAGGFGITILAAATNFLAAGLAAASMAIYLLFYTPLKTRTSLNTLVGAVVGAIPPMMGWVAATGRIDPGAWTLGALLFVWQIPHFLALAWMYREDYERGGYKMLPASDTSGGATFKAACLWSAALVPAGLTCYYVGVSGPIYAAVAGAMGIWLLVLALKLEYERSHAAAKKLFLATVIYLPIVMAVMVLDSPSGLLSPYSDAGILVIESIP